MATITTIDKTTQEGSGTYPLTANEVYKAVETIASQEINNVKSANVISDAYYDYQINNGKVIFSNSCLKLLCLIVIKIFNMQ